MMDDLIKLVPKKLYGTSGHVCYSGRDAFEKPSMLYLLGRNPGGCPVAMADATIEVDLERHRTLPASWSGYRDTQWREGGYSKMQKGVLHMFGTLGIDPADVPASNLMFKRTKGRTGLGGEADIDRLAQQCWPFHEAVIEKLGVRVVACLGGVAGQWVRRQIGAMDLEDWFIEKNNRRWASRAYVNEQTGLRVVMLICPSRGHWLTPATDPSALLQRSLERARGKRVPDPHGRVP